MQDDCRIFGNGKSSKTTNKNQHHKFPSGLGYPKPEGKDEGESYTLFRTLPFREKGVRFLPPVSLFVSAVVSAAATTRSPPRARNARTQRDFGFIRHLEDTFIAALLQMSDVHKKGVRIMTFV